MLYHDVMTWCGSTAKAVGKIQRFETSWLYGLINIFFRNAFAVFGHKSALLSTLVLHPTPPPKNQLYYCNLPLKKKEFIWF